MERPKSPESESDNDDDDDDDDDDDHRSGSGDNGDGNNNAAGASRAEDDKGVTYVLIEGPQGIGKSKLADCLVRHADTLDIPYVHATGDRVERNTPFFIWSNIMGTMLTDAWNEAYPKRESNHMIPLVMTIPDTASSGMSSHVGSNHIPRIPTSATPTRLPPPPPPSNKSNGNDDDDDDDDNKDDPVSSDDDTTPPPDNHGRRPTLPVPSFSGSQPASPGAAFRNSPNPDSVGALGPTIPPLAIRQTFSTASLTELTSRHNSLSRSLQDSHRGRSSVDMTELLINNGEHRMGNESSKFQPLLKSFLEHSSDDTLEVQGQARMEATRSMLYRLMTSFVDDCNPLLLVFEDVQNMDALSVGFLARECARLPNLMVVMTCRFEELNQSVELQKEVLAIRARPSTVVITLKPLPDEMIRDVLCSKLRVTMIPPEVLDAVLPRAEGNPFLAQEMIAHLQSLNIVKCTPPLLEFKSSELLASVATLPTSVEQIFRSRIDALPANLQLTLKIASVVACAQPSFSLQLLVYLHPQQLSDRDLLAMLDKLFKSGFIRNVPISEMDASHVRIVAFAANNASLQHLQETATTNPHFVFNTKVCQQAAYEMMLFGQRKPLHVRLARLYERSLAKARKSSHLIYPILALHYDRAEMWLHALDFYEKAGLYYVNQHARASVIDTFNTILRIYNDPNAAFSANPLDPCRVAKWHRLLAQAFSGTGQYNTALTNFQASLAQLAMPIKEGLGPQLMRKFTSSTSIASLKRRRNTLLGTSSHADTDDTAIAASNNNINNANNSTTPIHNPPPPPGTDAISTIIDKFQEAAHCYFGMHDLYVNHLYNRTEALYVANRLDHVTHSIGEKVWTCVADIVRCNANILANSPRESVIESARRAMSYLRSCESSDHPLLIDATLLLTRCLLAVCYWKDLEEALWISTTQLQRAVHQRKHMQNMYIQAVYFHSMGWYKNAKGILNQIMTYCETSAAETDLAIRCLCALVSIHVRLGDPNQAYELFSNAATLFASTGGSRTREDTLFDIAAAGALALTALHRIEHSIPYIAICLRWCTESARPYHTFQFVALRQFAEAILNMFWVVVGEVNWELDPSLAQSYDPLLAAMCGDPSQSPPPAKRFAGPLPGRILPRRHTKAALAQPARPPLLGNKSSTSVLSNVIDRRKSFSLSRSLSRGKGLSRAHMVRAETNDSVTDVSPTDGSATARTSTVSFQHYEPTEFTQDGVTAWIGIVASTASKLLLDYGAPFRCFRCCAWLSRGVHKMIKSPRHMEKAAEALKKCIHYSHKYQMHLEGAQAHLLLGWALTRASGHVNLDQVGEQLQSGLKALRNTQGEQYAARQITYLMQDLKISS